MKRSIRLNAKLLKTAESTGAQTKRSIASQIEYWAEIGRTVEASRQNTDGSMSELNDFNERFLKAIEQDTQSGRFKKDILATGYVFEKSKMGPGFVDKVFKSGDRVTGKISNGEFVEARASRKTGSR